MTHKISKKAIYSFVLFFMVYIVVFVSLRYFQYYNIVRYIFTALSFLLIFLNYKKIFKKKYRKIDILLLLFCGELLFSSYLNVGNATERNPLWAAIVFCAAINLVVYAAQYAIETGYVSLMVNTYFILCAFTLVITDFLLIFMPGLPADYSGYYFIGNKFTVVLTHYQMIVLFICKKGKNRYFMLRLFISFFMLLWTFVISLITDCATGLVGCFLLAIMLISQFVNIDLCKKKMFLIASAIVLAFPFAFALVVSIPLVQSMVYALGRNISMTGRQGIFVFVLRYIRKSPLFGFGYATSYELGVRLNGTTSTENCYLEWIWMAGIVGLLFLIVFFLTVISTINKYAKSKKNYSFTVINALLYTFLLIGSVGPSINESFFGVAAISLALGISDWSSGNSAYKALHTIEGCPRSMIERGTDV